MNRREFMHQTGLLAGLELAQKAGSSAPPAVSLVVDPGDSVAASAQVKWAVGELRKALQAAGVESRVHASPAGIPAGDRCVVVTGAGSSLPSTPEALSLSEVRVGGRPALQAAGSDARGLLYAVLELADRVRLGAPPLEALAAPKPVVETPVNRVRSITRCFMSEVEDKPWYHDRGMWPEYLTMLATQRYNRFALTLGLGYNYAHPEGVTDSYFFFSYPFLVDVPGYKVRAGDLPEAERIANLETLRFISDQAALRGLQFQFGLWTHSYEFDKSPNASYKTIGLTPETHAPYCRDALAAILKYCPNITGITLRVHGEGGIREGDYDFWETLYAGIRQAGRPIEIDMHAKGLDLKMIDQALATGNPVVCSPKYWGEHMGMSYQQASIRDLDQSPKNVKPDAFMPFSRTLRKFLRYSYGDLMKEDRKYGILFRVWPGTQRLLLWGNAEMAAGYARASSFCGSLGVEFCEPLSFKGRRDTGLRGNRCGYADASLAPRYDWQKYLYQYRLWGRMIYNPQTDPDGWRRQLRQELPGAAEPAERALGAASRILPIVFTTHSASADSSVYWPEIYTNMPIVDASRKHPYSDTPAPKRFGTVSALDQELFARIDDFADEVLAGGAVSGKYSPLEVAQWLEDAAREADRNLAAARARSRRASAPEFRRFEADVAIQSGLGLFFAFKMRSAWLWRIHDRTGNPAALEEAVKAYRTARRSWADLAALGRKIYVPDLTFGIYAPNRGHWSDRLPEIDADLADMERRLKEVGTAGTRRPLPSPPARLQVACRHTPAARFEPGKPLEMVLSGADPAHAVELHYRQVNHAEPWVATAMERQGSRHRAVIPAAYTHTPYPLQYYFELRAGVSAALYPGFAADLCNQPYFVVRGA